MRRIESRDSLKRGAPLSNVLCESCPLATDAIDIELMSLPNDLPPLRCVSSSIELDGYGVSSVSQLALAGCSVGGRSGRGRRRRRARLGCWAAWAARLWVEVGLR